MSSQSSSIKSIIFALSANLGIAVTKTVAAVVTGSGSMLAEAIHSYADCANQVLLFLGLKKSKKAPEIEHPLGHGKEIYFWSFIVALMLFSMGGLFSVYEGVNKIHAHEGLKSPMVAIIVLIISVVLEASSLYGCIKQINKIKDKNLSLWKWVKETRQSELIVVLGEDTAALIGLTFALIAILLATLTQNPVFDAVGSIFIGVLLVFVSIFLGIKVKGLLVGESAEKSVREEIDTFLVNRPEIESILNVITLQMGDYIMVSIKAKMKPVAAADELITNINRCEQALKEHIPDIRWVFFEPDIEK